MIREIKCNVKLESLIQQTGKAQLGMTCSG